MRRTKRICQKCGAQFWGVADRHYCPECAGKIKAENVVRNRRCIDCGQTFEGGPRAKRCPDCREIALRESLKRYRKSGTKRALGSTDICQWCGKEYIVISGRQKYCSEACQRLAVLEWQRQHKKGYHRKEEIYAEKERKREIQEKICPYCLRIFRSTSSSPYCSDYCRREQRKYYQCIADINRGFNRNLEKYEKARAEYREKTQSEGVD